MELFGFVKHIQKTDSMDLLYKNVFACGLKKEDPVKHLYEFLHRSIMGLLLIGHYHMMICVVREDLVSEKMVLWSSSSNLSSRQKSEK